MGLGRILSEQCFPPWNSLPRTDISSGIFSQSNYGICTKMGMTLMPNPGGYEAFVSHYYYRLQ